MADSPDPYTPYLHSRGLTFGVFLADWPVLRRSVISFSTSETRRPYFSLDSLRASLAKADWPAWWLGHAGNWRAHAIAGRQAQDDLVGTKVHEIVVFNRAPELSGEQPGVVGTGLEDHLRPGVSKHCVLEIPRQLAHKLVGYGHGKALAPGLRPPEVT